MPEKKDVTEMSEADLLHRGIEAVDGGDVGFGRDLLKRIPPVSRTPEVDSYLAFCLASLEGLIAEATALCTEAMETQPSNPVHYLNFGRIYLVAGEKKEAIRMFRDGLLFGENRLIRRELDRLGWREPPVFPSLGREHFLNKILGAVRRKMRKAS